MGLDMYLIGEKYLGLDFERPENNPREDGFRLERKLLRLGYWRKHPNLHGYIVRTFAGGVDDCRRIELDQHDIEGLIEAVARDDPPHTEGFFFGRSDGSEKDETLRILKAARDWLDTREPNVFRSVYYQASW